MKKQPPVGSDGHIGIIFRIIIIIISAVMLAWVNINPSITAGSWIGTAGFGVIILACAFWRPLCRLAGKIWRHIAGRIALVTLGGVIAVLAGFCLFFSGAMLARMEVPLEKVDAVIVLGCRVKGETPSHMLSRRLDAAVQTLSENPNAIVLVCGGKGEGEDISEAEAMRRYLVELGLENGRIILEDKSVNTCENIAYAADILRERGITENIVIVTSEFHQYRAYLFAKREGLKTGAHSARTLPLNLPNYWVREWAGLFHLLVYGT